MTTATNSSDGGAHADAGVALEASNSAFSERAYPRAQPRPRPRSRRFLVEWILLASLAGIGAIALAVHWTEGKATHAAEFGGPSDLTSQFLEVASAVILTGLEPESAVKTLARGLMFVGRGGAHQVVRDDPKLWEDLAAVGALGTSVPPARAVSATRVRENVRACVYRRGDEALAIAVHADFGERGPVLGGCPRASIQLAVLVCGTVPGPPRARRLRVLVPFGGNPVAPPDASRAYVLGDEARWGARDSTASRWLLRPDWGPSGRLALGVECGASRGVEAPSAQSILDLTREAEAIVAGR